MNPLVIAQALEALASLAGEAYNLYEQGKNTMSLTDIQAIHAALLQAEAATAQLRPRVDAALDAAAQQ